MPLHFSPIKYLSSVRFPFFAKSALQPARHASCSQIQKSRSFWPQWESCNSSKNTFDKMFFPKTCQQRCTLDLINTQCRNRISFFILNLIYTCLFSKVIEHLVCLHIPAVHWAAGAHNLPTITLMLFPNWCLGCSIQQMSFHSCWWVTYLK